MKKIDIEEIKSMYLSGKTYREIAKVFGTYYQTIARKLKDAGIKPRKSGRRRKFNIQTGQKINGFTIIKEKLKINKNNQYRIYYDCLCDCGRVFELYRGDIKRQKACHVCKGINISKAKFKGFNEISGDLFTTIKKSAEIRNLTFDLSIEFLWELFINQQRKCNLTGVDISFAISRQKKDRNTRTASLDRIDSSLGYTKNNVQWIHKEVNYLKMNKKEQDLLYWCKLIYIYNKDKI